MSTCNIVHYSVHREFYLSCIAVHFNELTFLLSPAKWNCDFPHVRTCNNFVSFSCFTNIVWFIIVFTVFYRYSIMEHSWFLLLVSSSATLEPHRTLPDQYLAGPHRLHRSSPNPYLTEPHGASPDPKSTGPQRTSPDLTRTNRSHTSLDVIELFDRRSHSKSDTLSL